VSDDSIDPSPLHSTVSTFPARSRLLVVDDEPLILEGLARLLATRDYDVVTANGGCEALIAIGKQQFDAILLDLGMPDLNGNEVLRFVAAGKGKQPHPAAPAAV
jgi:CheY-like chemotaxis protein